jgi:NAD(P)-dependent dehydrogenase (short-subunit alcohol dehydrogenase family)
MVKRRDLRDQRVLVTGAASGIGRATALAFAACGARLFVCDVNEGELPKLVPELVRGGAVSARSFCVDVSSEQAMLRLADEVHADGGALDVLVNNAGVCLAGGFLATTLEDWRWLMGPNLWGVVFGCHAFIPAMARRGRGHVVNVASAAGFFNLAELAAYGTTKYAVLGLSEALRDELAPLGIGVSAICPGFVRTTIVDGLRVRGKERPEHERQAIADFLRRRNFDPERVGRAIVSGVLENRALVLVTPEARALHALKRVAPLLGPRLVRRVTELFR